VVPLAACGVLGHQPGTGARRLVGVECRGQDAETGRLGGGAAHGAPCAVPQCLWVGDW